MDSILPNQKSVTVYANKYRLNDIEQGTFRFFNKMKSAFESIGYNVATKEDSNENILLSSSDPGYSLILEGEPLNSKSLCFRRAYTEPFWQIEKSAKRWEFEVASLPFLPDDTNSQPARYFTRYWRKKLFGHADLLRETPKHILCPLQGQLLRQRSFQSMSPLEMLEELAAHESSRPILATLHPSENYSQEEISALNIVMYRHKNISVSRADTKTLISSSSYIATMNSTVSFWGMFWGVPSVLFGRVDFHHLHPNTFDNSVIEAIKLQDSVDTSLYEKYIYWFWKQQSIRSWSDDAEKSILNVVNRRGWRL